jgi:hypothetical protein
MRAQQPQRRTLLQAIALGATWLSGLGSSVQGLAQTSYPNKPVTIVVPFPPAGGADDRKRREMPLVAICLACSGFAWLEAGGVKGLAAKQELVILESGDDEQEMTRIELTLQVSILSRGHPRPPLTQHSDCGRLRSAKRPRRRVVMVMT